jgi:hypothetical protein
VSKAAVNFVSRVAEQEPEVVGSLVEAHQQVPGLLRHPVTGRVPRDSDDVDLAGGELDEEQHVDPLQPHGIDGEEVARQDRVGLGGQELLPGGSGPAGCRVDAGPAPAENLIRPDGSRCTGCREP